MRGNDFIESSVKLTPLCALREFLADVLVVVIPKLLVGGVSIFVSHVPSCPSVLVGGEWRGLVRRRLRNFPFNCRPDAAVLAAAP